MKLNIVYNHKTWTDFYNSIINWKINHKNFLQKIINFDRKNHIKFGIFYTIEKKDEDYSWKIVFWLQEENKAKKEFLKSFSEKLKKFLEKNIKEQESKKQPKKDEKYSFEAFENLNCWVVCFPIEEGFSIFWFSLIVKNIFKFFYEEVFWEKDVSKSVNIYLWEPTKANWKEFEQTDFQEGNTWYLPDWLKINKDEGEFINEKYFWDVILNEELQKEIENLVNRYKNKTHFKKWNADEPKGILLYWPPGTGKTTIAKLIASELWLRFYTLSSSEIVSKWIWDSARNLDTFLKKIKPNSILFVDEIDSLIPRRGALWWDIWHENSERLSVVTTFLEYLDWTKTLKDVLFIWATNNIEHLDKAILRPWRFDYKLFIGLPDKESRIKLWKLYLKKVQENISFEIYDENIDFAYLADISNYFSGADIKEIVRRIMNDYAVWTLNLWEINFSSQITFKWLVFNIEKYKEEISLNKWIIPEKEKLYLKDIWGQDKLKQELKKIITQIKNKEKFEEFWVQMPKWILLYGPPGTGKTLAAKVIANESWILFYMLTAKDFVWNLWIEALEEKFSKLQSPSIVFIDEIDAIWQKRDYLNSYDIKVLNTFLQKMDWFVSSEDIFFVWATNNINILDEALLRAWRFDLKIFVDYPDLKGREEIFKIYINKSKTKNWERLFVKNIDYKEISLQTENFVWADIKELIRRLKQNLTLKIIENNLNLKWNEITSGDILIEIKNYKKEKNISPKKIWFEA